MKTKNLKTVLIVFMAILLLQSAFAQKVSRMKNMVTKFPTHIKHFEALSDTLKTMSPTEAAIFLQKFINEHDIQVIEAQRLQKGAIKILQTPRIKTKGRTITPKEGMDEELAAKIRKGSERRFSCIVQASRELGLTDIKFLYEFDIDILDNLGDFSFIAYIPTDRIDQIIKLGFIRWIGEYEITDKISPKEITELSNAQSELFYITPFKKGNGNYELELENMNVEIKRYDSIVNMYTVKMRPENIENILSLWWIKNISSLSKIKLEGFSEDLNFSPSDSRQLVNAPLVWSLGVTGNGVDVGVIDTGVWTDHPDFPNGSLLTPIFSATISGHGQHVAGIIASRGISLPSAKGVAYGSRILMVDNQGSGDPGGFWDWLLGANLDFGGVLNSFITRNIRINNNSWWTGSFDYEVTAKTADTYVENGITIIKSAGNQWQALQSITEPGTGKNVIAVGALEYTIGGNKALGELAAYSSVGPTQNDSRLKPDVVAPGGSDLNRFEYGVVSCRAKNQSGAWIDNSDAWDNVNYIRKSGTSMAAPHVSGIAALFYEEYFNDNSLGDGLMPRDFRAHLIANAIPLKWYGSIKEIGYGNTKSGYGLVDAYHTIFDVQGEKETILWVQGGIIETTANEQEWNVQIPDSPDKVVFVMCYEDEAGKKADDDAIKNDLDMVVEGLDKWEDLKPDDVNSEGPIEKIIDDNPKSSYKITIVGDRWNEILNPLEAERYSLVVIAYYKNPSIELSLNQTEFIVPVGGELKIPLSVENTGGRTAAGVTAKITGYNINDFDGHQEILVGNLVGENSFNDTFYKLTAPTNVTNSPYTFRIKASGINKGLLETKEIDITVNIIPSENVDVALVIDRSGSMGDGWYEPGVYYLQDAKSAANTFVGFMQPNDQIGVVSFSSGSSVDYPLTLITSDAIKTSAINAIKSLNAGGGTSIGGGIQLAQEQLNNYGRTDSPWAMVLLSDGEETASPDVADVLPTIPEQTDIYTIALGTYSDEALMNSIAAQTGGTYHFSPGPGALLEIYNHIRTKITGQQTLASFAGNVNQGQTVTNSAQVDGSVNNATFSVIWGGSDIDLELEDPNGRRIDPNIAASDPNISFTFGSTYEFYTINKPVAGEWQLIITGMDIPSGGEAYNVSVFGTADLKMVTYFDQEEYETGQPILVSANITEEGTPLTGATVTANIQTPTLVNTLVFQNRPSAKEEAKGERYITNNVQLHRFEDGKSWLDQNDVSYYTSTVISLYDDGMHGDGAADDGVYANYFTDTNVQGSYTFTVRASGFASQGGTFKRVSALSTFVNPTEDKINLLGLSGKTIYNIALHPTDKNVIYAGTNGSGMFKSTNRGTSWDAINSGIKDNRIFALVLDPHIPDRLYIGTGGNSQSDSERLYKSVDGGASWQTRNNGLPQKHVYSMAIDESNTAILFAGTHNRGVYKTTDRANQWNSAKDGIPTGTETHALAIHPTNSQKIFAGTQNGLLYKTTDGGKNWNEINIPGHGSYTFDIAFKPDNPSTMYIATNGNGVFKSTNSGNDWSKVNNGLTDLNIYDLKINSSGILHAGTQSNGIFTSDDNGSSWSHFSDQGILSTVHSIAFSTIEPGVFYVGTQAGVYRINQPGVIQTVAKPTFVPSPGSYTSPVNVTPSSATSGASIQYTTNGSTPTQSSPKYNSPISVNSTTTIKARAFKSGWTQSAVATGIFTITGTVAMPTFAPTPGTYASPVNVTLSCATSGAAIHYTTNGSTPTESSPLYTSQFSVSSTTTIKARAFKSGWTPSAVATGSYTITGTVATPTFSPEPKTYTTAVNVTLICSTSDAIIRFTTDGSTPSELSPGFTSPILVSSTTTIKARAFKSGWTPSAVATGTFTIIEKVATPEFSPEPKTYATPVNVTLSCSTSSAIIRYTTDGTTPSELSMGFSSPILVSSTTTIKARAFKSGWTPSAVVSGTYLITGTVATPTFSPQPGTYTTPVNVALACSTNGAIIRYTTEDTAPTELSPGFNSPISVSSTTIIKARAYKSGWTPSEIAKGIYEIELSTLVGSDELNELPTQYSLFQNYPNPFNPVTQIRYGIPELNFIRLKIYNLIGKEIRSLVNEKKSPGIYTVSWDGKDFEGYQVASGVYIYQLRTDGKVLSKKLILMR